MTSYVATTQEVTVRVRPVFLEDQSDILSRKFVFAYFVRIENHGVEPVHLLRRHWHIRHASGRREEVEGEGVIGRQPLIAPGTAYEYNSFCVLETFEGSMEGVYLMERPNGERFDAVIPRFTLRANAN